MDPRTRRHCGSDRGQTTIALAGVLAAACLLGLGLALLAQAMVHRARARNAADAVALATVADLAGAAELSEWYAHRGVEVDVNEGHAVARSGPSQAAAWAGLSQGSTQPAPVLVAIVARAEQLVGVPFTDARLTGMRVELLLADAALMHLVAVELGLCVAADPAPASGREAFEMC